MYFPRADMLRFRIALARHLGAGILEKLPQCPYLMGTVLGDRVRVSSRPHGGAVSHSESPQLSFLDES